MFRYFSATKRGYQATAWWLLGWLAVDAGLTPRCAACSTSAGPLGVSVCSQHYPPLPGYP